APRVRSQRAGARLVRRRPGAGRRGRWMTVGLAGPGRLAAWLGTEGIEVGQAMAVEPLAGGSSNAMFRVDRGAGRWVLRRPAKVAVARANDGMAREHRILAALEGTGVPHPAVVAMCDDHDVLGCT